MQNIYIDSNIWNFLYDNDIDMSKELPIAEFQLFIVGEQVLENRAIPEQKSHIQNFIKEKMKDWSVKEDRIFGFFDDRHSNDEQRIGGFDGGRFISHEEGGFISQQSHKIGSKKKKSRLYNQEADVVLGAMSMRFIVLTLDKKNGPLKDASEQGGRVLFVNEYDPSQEAFGEWIRRKC
ncbi:hypothetical protein GQ543_06475 [candidate division WOR-3 bacterium]|nr:hypothetical protein [candidate division WOR-3 bacterium]